MNNINLVHDTVNLSPTITAPAFISRNTGLPNVVPDENGLLPYVIAAKNPNGAFSIVTCGRTIGRSYIIPKCKTEGQFSYKVIYRALTHLARLRRI